ncbi:hypothetical protein AB0M58_14560 [Streptomyces bobili]|uniref:hypothetical protein n=1 Tax=Streptomyces bobili TaxID=67280 RepID=UPI003441BF4B
MITLPHTGLAVPDEAIRVTSYKEVVVGCDPAFTAIVRRNRALLGNAVNHGTGGDTRFMASSAEAHSVFAQFARRCAIEDRTPSMDEVLDCLAEEYRLSRAVAKADRRGWTLARNRSEVGYQEVALRWKPQRADDPVMAQALRERAPGTWSVWINGKWHTIETD